MLLYYHNNLWKKRSQILLLTLKLMPMNCGKSLVYLADELAKERAFRQKVRGALAYPIVVLVAALAVGLGVSFFVLPKLLDLFTGINVELPFTTRMLLSFATLMKDYGILLSIGVVFLVILIRFLISWPKSKPFFDNLILNLPLFGKIAQEIQLTLICRNLGVMLKSGLTIPTALEVESKAITNSIYQEYLRRLLDSVTKGQSLTSEFEKKTYSKIPLIAAKMVSVGEQTGKLDETFMYLADYFDDSVEDSVKNITTLLEPILLLTIGVIVGFVALSIITPIYSLTGSINP